MKLEDKIKNAFKEECPDVLDRIMQSVENEEQLPREERYSSNKFLEFIKSKGLKKISALAACFLLVFTLGIFLGNGIALIPPPGGPTPSYASLYIDVNPSVELVIDTENRVVECNALNADAEAVLNGMELQGVSMHTALNAIIGSMYMNGYLDAANETDTILISTKADDESKFVTLLSDVANDVNSILSSSNIICSIVAQRLADNHIGPNGEQIEQSGISHGKAALINKILSVIGEGEYDFNTLAEMKLKQLNSLYHSIMDDIEDDGNDEIFFRKPSALKEAEAIDTVLSYLGYSRDDVSEPTAKLTLTIKPDDDELESVYLVSFKIDGEKYEYYIETDYEDSEDIWEKESIFDQFPDFGGLDDLIPHAS